MPLINWAWLKSADNTKNKTVLSVVKPGYYLTKNSFSSVTQNAIKSDILTNVWLRLHKECIHHNDCKLCSVEQLDYCAPT